MSETNGASHVQPDTLRRLFGSEVQEPSPGGEAPHTALDQQSVEALVVDTLVELTRYPREILVPTAHLEEDLGIDSVKRGEIFAVLRSRLGAAARTNEPAASAVPPATIADVVALVLSFAKGQPAGGPSAGAAPVAAAARSNPGDGAAPPPDVRALVIDTIADLTRYPREIISDDADIEEDLGIDSVKRGEILATLASRLGIDARAAAGRQAAAPRTIGQLITLTAETLAAATAPGPVPAPAVAVMDRATESKTSFTNPSIASHQSREREGARPTVAARAPDFAPAPPNVARPAVPGAAPATGANGVRTEDLSQILFSPSSQSGKAFQDRVALVTGSGHGLGKVIALQLAELGAKVIVNSFYSRDRGEATAAEINGRFPGSAIHLWGSIANRKQLDGLFDQIGQRFGYLDFYVQNASNGVIGPLEEVTEDHWDRGFRTNVVGFHHAAFRAAELMKRRGGGRIVALSSPGAQRYLEYFGCLGPIKAAVESLALYLAVDLGPHNIQVNVVSAGPVYGERLTNYPDADRLIPYWEQLSADRRLGDATEISSNVIYLLSPAARKINGSVLLVDGAASQRM
jgi:enoyl-[acyl-carrier protein] reductase III